MTIPNVALNEVKGLHPYCTGTIFNTLLVTKLLEPQGVSSGFSSPQNDKVVFIPVLLHLSVRSYLPLP